MNMKRTATRAAIFAYPVELVWKAIIGEEQRKSDPITEDEFENCEPAPNTMLFKSLEVVTNEVFSFRIKTRVFLSDIRIELLSLGPCKTQMKMTQSVQYRKMGAFIGSGFGANLPGEITAFIREVEKRLDKNMKK